LRLVTFRTEAGPQKDAPGKIVHDEPGRLALESEADGMPDWSGDPYNRSTG
jgi:hypothetical protein